MNAYLILVVLLLVGSAILESVVEVLNLRHAGTGVPYEFSGVYIRQPGLYAAFGLDSMPLYAGLVFFGVIYTPVSMLQGMLENRISRRHEYEVDTFAARIRALRGLTAGPAVQHAP